MKVCHLTSTHKSNDQRIFYKECISLIHHGYDVFLVAQGKTKEINGVHIIGTGETIENPIYRLIIRPIKVYEIALAIDADIYQIHDMELLPYANKLKQKGKIVVFDYHEDYASRFEDSDSFNLPKFVMKLLSRIYRNYEKTVISRLDAMISVTPHICDRLKNINANTIMITNYPILNNTIWNSPIYYNDKSDYIAFAGQISNYYSLDTAICAVQNFSNLFFKICGPQRRNNDLQQLKDLDTKNRLKYLGIISFTDVPYLISGSRAALVTFQYTKDTDGKRGTLGNNKLFETMVRGIPVICTDFTLWREIIDKYNCGICVEPGNLEQLIMAIKSIIDNPDEAKKMGENGRKAVELEYNWESQETKLIDLYKSLDK